MRSRSWRQKEIINFKVCFHYCPSVPSELKLTEAQLSKHKPTQNPVCFSKTSLLAAYLQLVWEFKTCWSPKDTSAWTQSCSQLLEQPAWSCSLHPSRWTRLPRHRAGSKGVPQHLSAGWPLSKLAFKGKRCRIFSFTSLILSVCLNLV